MDSVKKRFISLTAGSLIACMGVNTALGLDQVAAAPQDSAVTAAPDLAASDSADVSPVVRQTIENLDVGERAELDSIYAEAQKAPDFQQRSYSWKTWLAKAILKSSAFRKALRAVSERAYVWYMGHINPVVNAMDAVTSWEVNGITIALVAVGVPQVYAKFIATVLAFFL